MTSKNANLLTSEEYGFSLLELLVFFLLLSIVSGAALGLQANRTTSEDLESVLLAVERLALEASLRAVSSKSEVKLTFDSQSHTIHSSSGKSLRVPQRLQTSVTYGRSDTSRSRALASIIWFPDGTSSGGEFRISDGNAAAKISIFWLSGQVTVERSAKFQ